ncbi:arsenic transporter [Candidatus Heimdallarchaeota archaeon B3_Heim]|nr:MAG: arsenic transporter [Candidatus Heimdallarchaeota archaeon B3_Heim]
MATSYRDFIQKKPNLKYIFTGGKGGVGKTISAAAIALDFARKGKRVLLSSLNPVHSLSSLFDQNLPGGKVAKIEGLDGLWVCEIEITETVERYKKELKRKIDFFLKYADIPVKTETFVEIATTNPSFEESAQFDQMTTLMIEKQDEFDVMVFDTAAVANAVRLIGLSKLYDLWLSRMIESRKEALSLRMKLSFRKEKIKEEISKDPLMADLLKTKRRTDAAKKLLTDSEKTAFFFITLPLALPIAVVERFITMVSSFDIPVGGIIVNKVILEDIVEKETTTDYLRNAYNQQETHLNYIHENLGNLLRANISLFETEILGLKAVEEVADMITI